MIKVLHLGKYYPPDPGGIEYVLKNLLQATGFRFENHAVVACKGPRHSEENGPDGTVYRRKEIGTLFLTPIIPGLFLFLLSLRRREKFDCIVLHAPNPMTAAALFVSCLFLPLREKLVIYYHGDILVDAALHRLAYFLFRPIENWTLGRADRIVATSPNQAGFSGNLMMHAGKVTVIPLMVPDDWSDTTEEEREEARKIRERFGAPMALFVGRLVAYKGLSTLVDAAPMVPRGTFLIVGDGPLEADLKKRAAERGVEDRLIFLGRAPDLKPYYLACDLLVLPSASAVEMFGLVQLEAMSFGKPAVTSDLTTGVTYANLDGKTGLTFPVGNSGKLAEALNNLFTDDPLRKRLGEFAGERVRKEFRSSVVGEKFVRLVQDLCGKGTPA
ncbi:MAG: glycosyltransferase [Deltaproteobacteria bacterium]|nr:glycosyltransferase [Deltaproteobacteria bacterium]